MIVPKPVLQVAPDVLPADEPGAADWKTYTVRTSPGIACASGSGRLAGSEQGMLQLVVNNDDGTVPIDVKAGRHARLQTTVDGTTHKVYRGFVDDWTPAWGLTDDTINVDLVDGFAWIGLQDRDIDLPAQMTHERITALLDLAEWPVALRDIDDGVVDVEAVEQNSANLLRTLEDTADAEQGDLYVAPDGKITFRSRHARFNTTASITLGGTGNIGIASAEPARDTGRIVTIARVELDDGTVYEDSDTAAVDDFGERVEPIRDLPLRRAEAIALAQWEVVRFKDQHTWIDGLEVHAPGTGFGDLLDLRVGDAARIIRDPLVGEATDELFDIDRIRHEIDARAWSVLFDLSPQFGDRQWFAWDDPVNGWDSGALWAP